MKRRWAAWGRFILASVRNVRRCGAGLSRPVGAIGLNKRHGVRLVASVGSSLLNACSAAEDGAVTRRTSDLVLCIVWLRVPVRFRFAFSRCEVPGNGAPGRAAEQGNAKP
ncbi:hypothetical protein ERJ75_000555200 [Trypanosoma vivax]|nr:hypothetical protein ERJ75_000555200 [Trypanosoma vivax]